jgi:hypothetical protein
MSSRTAGREMTGHFGSTMRHVASVALLVAAMTGVAAAQAAAEPAGGAPGQVRVVVTRVRATAAAEPGAKADIDPALAKLNIGKLRLGYGKYVADGVVEQVLQWGEPSQQAVDKSKPGPSGGLYKIVPMRLLAPDRVVLHVEETAPGEDKTCLRADSDVQAGQTHLWFCDSPLPEGTVLFFARVDLVEK